MKRLVLKLENKLKEKGYNLNITGLELMKVLNIKVDDIKGLCEQAQEELYDNYWIECSTKYIDEIKKVLVFDEGVYWYEKASDDSPVYETSDLKTICENCEIITGHFVMGRGLDHYSVSLPKIVNALKNIVLDEAIKLSLAYLGDCLVLLEIDRKGISKVNFEIVEFKKLDEFDQNMLLYQLIVLSHKDKIIDVLNMLQLR